MEYCIGCILHYRLCNAVDANDILDLWGVDPGNCPRQSLLTYEVLPKMM
jgi:hypothetical protein